MKRIGHTASEEKSFENVRDDRRRIPACTISSFISPGELKTKNVIKPNNHMRNALQKEIMYTCNSVYYHLDL